jgi:hypothetical protein
MFRFTIRDVLWLTVVVALAVAFCVERSQRVAATREVHKIRTEQAQAELQAAYYADLQRARDTLLVAPNQSNTGN